MPVGESPLAARAVPQGPFGTSVVGPYAGKDPLAFGTDNTFRVGEGQEVRLVDAGGNVIFSGSGVEGANRAVAVAQSISDELGKNANFKIQTGERTINPDGSVGGTRYIDVARAAPQQSGLGFLADAVLPFAASFIPVIGPIAGAALGSAASSAAQGRSLEDTLLRAAITAGASAAFPGAPTPSGATVGSNLPSFGSLAAPYATGAAAGSAVGSAAGGAAGGLIDDIIVTALNKTAPSVLGPAVTGGIANTLLDRVISQPAQPAEVQQPAPQEYTPPPEDIVLTAPQNILPPALTAPEALAASAAANALGSTVAQSPDVTQGMTQQEIEDITMKGAGGGGLLAKLTANMGLTDYLTAASLLGSGVSSLFGGGSGGTTAVPYVSPFGSGLGGAGFGSGQDFRVNPNISDYERYGFGPEASFFAPGYSQLVSGAAGAPMQAPTTMGPQGAMVNPQYVPLI